MARQSAGELVVSLTARTGQFEAAMNRAASVTQKTGSSMNGFGAAVEKAVGGSVSRNIGLLSRFGPQFLAISAAVQAGRSTLKDFRHEAEELRRLEGVGGSLDRFKEAIAGLYGDTTKTGAGFLSFFRTGFDKAIREVESGGDSGLAEKLRAEDKAAAEDAAVRARNPIERLAEIQQKIREAQRNVTFGQINDPGERAAFLQKEVEALLVKEKQAKLDKDFIRAGELRLEIIGKEADVAKERKTHEEQQRKAAEEFNELMEDRVHAAREYNARLAEAERIEKRRVQDAIKEATLNQARLDRDSSARLNANAGSILDYSLGDASSGERGGGLITREAQRIQRDERRAATLMDRARRARLRGDPDKNADAIQARAQKLLFGEDGVNDGVGGTDERRRRLGDHGLQEQDSKFLSGKTAEELRAIRELLEEMGEKIGVK